VQWVAAAAAAAAAVAAAVALAVAVARTPGGVAAVAVPVVAAVPVAVERRDAVAAGRPPWVASFAASAVRPLPFALPDASPS